VIRLFLTCFCLTLTPLLTSCSAQTSPKSSFDGERAYAELGELLALGERVPGTEGSLKAQGFIKSKLAEAGVEVREFPFEAFTPLGMREMNTIVGVIPGTRDEVIVLSNHYDTKYFPNFEFLGANDGGSTTAWMLEMARTLGPKREGATIWLCFFDGEEAFEKWTEIDSLYGSRELVKILKKSGEIEKIGALINVDMIGDCDLGVFQDPDAPKWLQRIVEQSANDLGHGKAFLPWGERVLDDHIPFRKAGVDAINLIDFRFGGGKPIHDRNWHTVRDTIDLVCADSLKVIGDVVFHAIPRIEARILETEDE
jgi:glutaminyl-peptide cyclotransferase